MRAPRCVSTAPSTVPIPVRCTVKNDFAKPLPLETGEVLGRLKCAACVGTVSVYSVVLPQRNNSKLHVHHLSGKICITAKSLRL